MPKIQIIHPKTKLPILPNQRIKPIVYIITIPKLYYQTNIAKLIHSLVYHAIPNTYIHRSKTNYINENQVLDIFPNRGASSIQESDFK